MASNLESLGKFGKSPFLPCCRRLLECRFSKRLKRTRWMRPVQRSNLTCYIEGPAKMPHIDRADGCAFPTPRAPMTPFSSGREHKLVLTPSPKSSCRSNGGEQVTSGVSEGWASTKPTSARGYSRAERCKAPSSSAVPRPRWTTCDMWPTCARVGGAATTSYKRTSIRTINFTSATVCTVWFGSSRKNSSIGGLWWSTRLDATSCNVLLDCDPLTAVSIPMPTPNHFEECPKGTSQREIDFRRGRGSAA